MFFKSSAVTIFNLVQANDHIIYAEDFFDEPTFKAIKEQAAKHAIERRCSASNGAGSYKCNHIQFN